jgi:hypothetical protein
MAAAAEPLLAGNLLGDEKSVGLRIGAGIVDGGLSGGSVIGIWGNGKEAEVSSEGPGVEVEVELEKVCFVNTRLGW